VQLAAIIDRARAEHVPVYLARRGRRVAAVIDADDLRCGAASKRPSICSRSSPGQIEDEELLILVLRIGHRREVYASG
jgi:prevent-host-death family protein